MRARDDGRHPRRAAGRSPLEERDLIGRAACPLTVPGVAQDGGRVADERGVAGQLPQGVDEERGDEHRRERAARLAGLERLPAENGDAPSPLDAGIAQRLGQGREPRPVDAHQAERRTADDVDVDRDDRCVDDALLADDQRPPTAREDQQRLLEPGIEVAEVGEVPGVLAVGVDDDRVGVDRGEEVRDPRLVLGGGDLGAPPCRNLDRRQADLGDLDRRLGHPCLRPVM